MDPLEKLQDLGEARTEARKGLFDLSALVEQDRSQLERVIFCRKKRVDILETRAQALQSRRRKQRRQHG